MATSAPSSPISNVPMDILFDITQSVDPKSALALKSTCNSMKQRVYVSRSRVALQAIFDYWNFVSYSVVPQSYKRRTTMCLKMPEHAFAFTTTWEGDSISIACYKNNSAGEKETVFYSFRGNKSRFNTVQQQELFDTMEAAMIAFSTPQMQIAVYALILNPVTEKKIVAFPMPSYIQISHI